MQTVKWPSNCGQSVNMRSFKMRLAMQPVQRAAAECRGEKRRAGGGNRVARVLEQLLNLAAILVAVFFLFAVCPLKNRPHFDGIMC